MNESGTPISPISERNSLIRWLERGRSGFVRKREISSYHEATRCMAIGRTTRFMESAKKMFVSISLANDKR